MVWRSAISSSVISSAPWRSQILHFDEPTLERAERRAQHDRAGDGLVAVSIEHAAGIDGVEVGRGEAEHERRAGGETDGHVDALSRERVEHRGEAPELPLDVRGIGTRGHVQMRAEPGQAQT